MAPAMVRVPGHVRKRSRRLDSGAQGVLILRISTAAQAAGGKASRYPPKGERCRTWPGRRLRLPHPEYLTGPTPEPSSRSGRASDGLANIEEIATAST
jgi:4-hydroxy-2-oxoheptanedioate aldolase